MGKLTFKPVTKAKWPDFEALFETAGAPKYCWFVPAFERLGFEKVGKAGSRRHVMRLGL